MKTNLTHVLLCAWASGIRNFLVAVALGLLGGATLSAIDRAVVNDCVQETLSSGRYLP
jgi:hypothetical protein